MSPTTTRRFRFNTMVAKLMELSNPLFRYRGTPVAGGAAWDEAIRLLLLMLAPAAPHITEELWSRRGGRGRRASGPRSTASRGRRSTSPRPPSRARGAGPGQRQAPRQVDGRGAIAARELEAAALASPKVAAILAGRQPDKIIVAGGGRLINIVVREV